MSNIKYDTFAIDMLKKKPKLAEEYFRAAVEEFYKDNNLAILMTALKHIAEARGGIAKIAKESKVDRCNLYKYFSGKVEPKVTTFMEILRALSCDLNIKVARI